MHYTILLLHFVILLFNWSFLFKSGILWSVINIGFYRLFKFVIFLLSGMQKLMKQRIPLFRMLRFWTALLLVSLLDSLVISLDSKRALWLWSQVFCHLAFLGQVIGIPRFTVFYIFNNSFYWFSMFFSQSKCRYFR